MFACFDMNRISKDEDKREIRKQIRELKKKYTLQQRIEKSGTVWEQVERDMHFQKSQVVLAFWSMDDEVFTHDFVCRWARHKQILLPCVRGNDLDIRRFDGEENLCPGENFAIPEPVGVLYTALEDIDVILVPGVAFDPAGGRLGRGKGYYDRILKETDAFKIGICFDFQLIQHVPMEVHDVFMNRVICSA